MKNSSAIFFFILLACYGALFYIAYVTKGVI